MVKLTDRKIRWIIREKEKGVLSTSDIARLQNVSESRVRQLWCQYKKSRTVPSLGSPGRPHRAITGEETSAVLGIHRENPCGAVVLESVLLYRHGIKIPHNIIHRILKEHHRASNEASKQKRRKWVKYEKDVIA